MALRRLPAPSIPQDLEADDPLETTRQCVERLGWLPETFIAVNADNEPEFASSLTDEEREQDKSKLVTLKTLRRTHLSFILKERLTYREHQQLAMMEPEKYVSICIDGIDQAKREEAARKWLERIDLED